MHLTEEEKSFLAGEHGAGVKKAMEILVAFGKIFEAQKMIPVASAQVAGVSYKNIGDPGLEFLTDWAKIGAKARIPAFMNPAGIDRAIWEELGIDEHFAEKQTEIINVLTQMDIIPTLTCTPYHIGYTPSFGQHIAWSESSAVSYANSVLGARTNREGGPSALASAITGRTPEFGLHLAENRKANYIIDVKCKVSSLRDFNLLGYLIGKQVGNGIPYFYGLDLPELEWKRTNCLKALGAAMAASGAVALYHIHNETPESKQMKEGMIATDAKKINILELQAALSEQKYDENQLDLVTIGCPHLSIEELKEIMHMIQGKNLKTELWLTTSFQVRKQAEEEGVVDIIKKAGGTVISDTCMVVAPLKELGLKYVAVNSAKAACYLPSHQEMTTYWGSTEQCIESALEGRWKF